MFVRVLIYTKAFIYNFSIQDNTTYLCALEIAKKSRIK